jgi:hypothetical protein
MIIEPILREPGSVSFSWMEIQRTKASLVQQIEQQTNFTANETLLEFGLFPKDGDCEHKCPELDACIASNLWCDGKYFSALCDSTANLTNFCLPSCSVFTFKATPTAPRATMSRRRSAARRESFWNCQLVSSPHWAA